MDITVCNGCLSNTRKLTTLHDAASKKWWNEFILTVDATNPCVSLCFECIALFRRIVRFKKQVAMAQQHLQSHMLQQISVLECYSTLVVKKLDYYELPVIKDSKITSNYKKTKESHPVMFVKIEDGNSQSPETLHLIDLRNYETNNLDIINTTYNIDNYESPVQIATTGEVKIEDEISGDMRIYDDEQDESYIDKEEHKRATRLSKRKNAQRQTDIEFTESDDEPLKCKQNDAKKCKRRCKSKIVDKATKIDRRKNPGPKKEKPSGVVRNARVEKKLKQLNVPEGQLEMVVLSWEEVEEERQTNLTSEAFTRHEYRCYECIVGFNHRLKLDNHMNKHLPESGAVECSVCHVRCRDKHALAAHRRRHRVRWRCCTCGARWSRASVAADHCARAHGRPPAAHACPHCPAHTEPTLGKLRNHIKSHGERQKCELCGKTFRDRASLRTHLFIHRGEKEFSCPKCEKRFVFKKAMEIHLITHDTSAQLYCHQCDMNFKNRMSYYQHMRYNLKHVDPDKLKYACQLCDKKFLKSSRLEEHNLAVHLKMTPIKCTVPDCDFACSSRAVLRTHTRVLHRALRAKRNHVCHTCGKAYTTKKTLEGHLRSHTGERPFHCKLCPSTFGYEAALYNHNRLVHLKLKPCRDNRRVAIDPVVPDENTMWASTETS